MNDGLKMKDVAYSVIKNKILSNEFEFGDYLEEKMLCELVGVSRTPIREAIAQLANENLVTTKPNKGIFVTSIGVKESKELFQARIFLEPIALELAWPHLEEEVLEQFLAKTEEAVKNVEFKELNEIDYEFHNYINSNCNNEFILNMMNRLQDQFQRVRTLSYYDQDRIIGGAHEHIELIDMMKKNQLEKAKERLQDHIRSTEKYYYMSLMNS